MITRYRKIFCREALDQLACLQSGLLALEKQPGNPQLVHELLRNTHTLKGSARMVGLNEISSVTHRMEEHLKELGEGSRPVQSPGIDLLLKATDLVAGLVQALSRGETPQLDVAQFLEQYERGELTSAEPVQSEPTGSDTVRAKVKTLDTMVNLIGELIINKKRFEARAQELHQFTPLLPPQAALRFKEWQRDQEEEILYLDYLIQELHGKAMGLRMLPLKSATEGLERLVRDLCLEQEKEVRLELVGGGIELDRVLLENLKPALLHLVSNAICHGIETAAQRHAAGKPTQGTLRITARHEGNTVLVSVLDDGRGMDAARIRQSAVSRGLISEEEARGLKDEEACYLTLRPGFSTAGEITDSAGRGVGLDVVKKKVDRVKGNLTLKSERGQYCEVQLQLPLTLSLIEVLLVEAGGETYAIPLSYVQELLKIHENEVEELGGREWVRLRGMTVPVASLSGLLGLPTLSAGRARQALILRLHDERLALTVDAHLGNSEVVVKGLGGQFGAVPFVFAATILGDGTPALILNVPDLCEAGSQFPSPPKAVLPRPAKVLVVDDSITTRTLEQSILTARGYRVATAVHAEAALELAGRERFDLVISDVEMPGMNGFQLTRTLRQTEGYQDTPIIIVSSLGRDEDKRQAVQAGAQAYVVKSDFDQQRFLETVEMLVG